MPNYLKLSSIKQQIFIISWFLWGRNPGIAELAVCGSRFLMRFQSSCWAGLQFHLEAQVEVRYRTTFKLTHVVTDRPWSLIMWSSHRLPHSITALFPWDGCPKESERECYALNCILP